MGAVHRLAVAQTWRRALIEATGIKPRKFED
jgi:hypothetical protein